MFMASSSSSSPATAQVMKYDVFLSFRGEDTRNTFTSYLYGALRWKKINTFMDDKLPRGDEISPSLSNTIKESKISIIVFSKNYADSRWCLQELEQILDCRRTHEHTVIPVFYHVLPSDVKKQEGAFGDAFAKIQERFKERLDELQRWKAALEEAANISGYHIDDKKTENEYVKSIADDILHKLRHVSSTYDKDLVGAQFSIEKVKSLLRIASNGVHIVGIWGIGGIGKTTIARAVFNQIWHQFDGSYFAANVREEWEKSPGLTHLQTELLFGILRDRDSSTIEMLGSKKVLIIFDDVSHFQQIEKLIGNFNSLSSKSQIIITTRDKHVLKNCGVDDFNLYEVEGLCGEDALQLFCKCAFGQIYPRETYKELSNKVLIYAKGVPLALKVLGHYLRGRTENDWKSKMKKLEKSLDKNIHEVLRISYDGLDNEEKEIFLDIACFFKGCPTSFVTNILDASGFSTQIGLSRLTEMCLIAITKFDNQIMMHDLLQEMGKEIVRKESNDLQKRSRLWVHEDICNVFKKNMGKKELRGLCLDISKLNKIRLDPHAFSKMHNLRFFIVYNQFFRFMRDENYQFSSDYFNDYKDFSTYKICQFKLDGFKDLKYFSTKVFSWEYYPFKSLPSNFHVEDLVRLDMPKSNVEKLWKGVQDLVNLRYIELSYSIHLKKIPDLSKAVRLQELNLRYCKRLESLPDNISSKSIALCGCPNLKMVPKISCKVEELDLSGTAIKKSPIIEDQSRLVRLDLSLCSRLTSLSNSICKCKFLEYLSVNDCSKLERLPEDLGNLEALKTLLARGVGLREVPSSILNLNQLSLLSLSRLKYQGPLNWPPNPLSDLRSLEYVGLANCQLTKLPNNLGQFSSLRELHLFGNDFESIPASIKCLSNLCYLDISYSKRLIFLPELPKGINVNACNCSSLESISESPLQVSPMLRPQRLNLARCFKLDLSDILRKAESERKILNNVCYPGNQVPKWFDFRNKGSEIDLKIGQHWINENVLGLNMCIVLKVGERYEVQPKISYSFNIKSRKIKDKTHLYERTISGYINTSWRIDKFGCSEYVFMDFSPTSKEEKCASTYIAELDGKEFTEENDILLYARFGACINSEDGDVGWKIKRCGVHFVYGSECKVDSSHFMNCEKASVRDEEAYIRDFINSDEEAYIRDFMDSDIEHVPFPDKVPYIRDRPKEIEQSRSKLKHSIANPAEVPYRSKLKQYWNRFVVNNYSGKDSIANPAQEAYFQSRRESNKSSSSDAGLQPLRISDKRCNSYASSSCG